MGEPTKDNCSELRHRGPVGSKLTTSKPCKGGEVVSALFNTPTPSKVKSTGYGVDYLNAKVTRMIIRAKNNLAEGETLKPCLKIVEDEKIQVYKFRNRLVLALWWSFMAICTIVSWEKLSWKAIALICFVRFIMVDLYSGVLHIWLDSEEYMLSRWPGWDAALEFQWHHEIPQDIASKPFIEVVGDLLGIMTLYLSQVVVLMYFGMFTYHLALTVGVSFVLATYLQASHRMSHTRPKDRPMWAKFLQNTGLMVHPDVHQRHHQVYVENFCICHGQCNGFLNWIIVNVLSIRHCFVWFGLLIVMTFIEPYLTNVAIMRFLGAPTAENVLTFTEITTYFKSALRLVF